ncbi:MAG: hypothetical protein K0S71_651 [Clostridia bacterium]|jgi:hypothetical protein|nr:hypothetical protein [Clostridia bacterium]
MLISIGKNIKIARFGQAQYEDICINSECVSCMTVTYSPQLEKWVIMFMVSEKITPDGLFQMPFDTKEAAMTYYNEIIGNVNGVQV